MLSSRSACQAGLVIRGLVTLTLGLLFPPFVNRLHSQVNLQCEITYLLEITAKKHVLRDCPEALGQSFRNVARVPLAQQFSLRQDQNRIHLLSCRSEERRVGKECRSR